MLDTAGGGQLGYSRSSPRRTNTSCCFAKSKSYPKEDSVLCCCCTCPTPNSSASILTCIGICIIIVLYTLLGAVAFMALEGTLLVITEDTAIAASQSSPGDKAGLEMRSKTVEKLWSITEDLNILYKDNWTRLAAQEVMEFQEALVRAMRDTGTRDIMIFGRKHQWSLSSSFLYSLTIITTIGYGNVTPKTAAGKIVTIMYAIMGIPLMLVYLSTVGDVLARNFRRLYNKTCRPSKKSQKTPPKPTPTLSANVKGYFGDVNPRDNMVILDCIDPSLPLGAAISTGGFPRNENPVRKRLYHRGCPDQVRVPIVLCMFIILVYMTIGAFVFNKTENWSILEGSYFCFTSLSTVGFGDLYPGDYASKESSQAEDIALGICSLYILIGMAVIAMCFNLVQDEIIVLVRKFNRACGGNTSVHVRHNDDIILEKNDDLSLPVVS